jgi:glycogen(starch) synthase
MEAEVISTFDLPPNKVDGVPNGVDAPAWAPPPAPPARGGQGPLVVTWGRIQYEKGFQTLVLAVPALRDTVPGLRVVIAGRGSYLAELQSLAQRLGVEPTVEFAGFVPDADLQRLLHEASAVVIPSLYEPFGIVALEALAAGAPLIAADTGGMGEVLRGTDAGLLYPPGDPVALADALQRMLTEPGLAERSQAAGRELVTGRYSWDTVAAATARVYERVLAPAGLPARP